MCYKGRYFLFLMLSYCRQPIEAWNVGLVYGLALNYATTQHFFFFIKDAAQKDLVNM